MKTKILLYGLLGGAMALLAQDGDHAMVPLHDPSHPARIRISVMAGSVIVKGADVKEVNVETRPHARGDRDRDRDRDRERNRDSRSEGMKRLELPGTAGLDITEDNNQVNIKTTGMRQGSDVFVTVPRHSSLQIKAMNAGDIEVEQVDGEIDANNLNGKVTLKNVSGSVLAHSMNGAVTVSMDRVDEAKPMSFSTMNGDIDVTLPPEVKANVVMKTDMGEIYSDFDVNLKAAPFALKKDIGGRQADGTYHLRFDHTLRGAIDGGGPEYQFTTFNGQIYIRKKK